MKNKKIKRIVMSYILVMLSVILVMMCSVIVYLMKQIGLYKDENLENVSGQTQYQFEMCVADIENIVDVLSSNLTIQNLFDKSSTSANYINAENYLLSYTLQSGGKFKVLFFDKNGAASDVLKDIDNEELKVIKNLYRDKTKKDRKNVFIFEIPENVYENIYVCMIAPINKVNLKRVGNDRVGYIAVFETINKIEFQKSLNSYGYINIEFYNKNINEKTNFIVSSKINENSNALKKEVKLDNTDWFVRCTLNEDILKTPYGITLIWIITIMLLLIVFILMLDVTLSKTIDKPVGKIIDFLSDYHIGKNNLKMPESDVYEFDKIQKYILKMIKEIDSATHKIIQTQQELYEKSLNEKEQLLYMYQLQINPHFLYNSLACISGLTTVGNKEGIMEITEGLSDIFRYSLNESFETTVEKEIYITQKYINILKIRHPDKIDYHIDIQDEIYDYPILKMILQPVIENSYKYGISPKNGKGLILIKGYFEDEYLVLSVRDNGCGIEPGLYEKLKQRLNEPISGIISETGKRIGIINISNRLKIRYGEQSGVEINTEYGEYTEVRLKIFCADKLSDKDK